MAARRAVSVVLPLGRHQARQMCAEAAPEQDLSVPWGVGRSIYRKMLRAASNYPSKKRAAIYDDIRADFKDHMHETDQKKLLRYRSQAISGLAGLEHYSQAAQNKESAWEVGPIKHGDPRSTGMR
uniref:Complex 1 LYR protein domain-containing protein n=1 Tax=Hemiselmis tepida TaxID=464990 RepID=A0A7S0VJC3_9CRYP|mmetsp:Transcript_15996/g.40561  ORF Transcript_15996/g.40561 Transcript_15996/m.40561 type:complete len:125 (+) Transcript_15996:3-377(+)